MIRAHGRETEQDGDGNGKDHNDVVTGGLDWRTQGASVVCATISKKSEHRVIPSHRQKIV
jgi:hypothetical protein